MPLLYLSLAFIIGLLLASILYLPVWGWVLFALISLSIWLFLHYRITNMPGISKNLLVIDKPIFHRIILQFQKIAENAPLPLLVLLMAVFLGAARWQMAQPEISPEHVAYYNDKGVPMVVVGVVQDMPDVGDSYINLGVHAETIRVEHEITHQQVGGLLLARVPTTSDLQYGDRVVLTGLLETPPEGEEFSYAEYLARQGVYSYMPYAQAAILERKQGNFLLSWVYRVKATALDRLYRYLPDPEASLLAGILLGVESGIPHAVEQAFQDTGTSHIIAISGFNITIIAGLFVVLFGRLFGRRWGALSAAVAIMAYTMLVGADAAVVRAAIMGGLALGARQLGRRQHGLNSLGLAAVVMAVFNPNILWDVGFQLSFAATLGLVWYAEPLQQASTRWLARTLPRSTVKRLSAPLAEYLLFTVAAQITTLPLIVYHFQQVPLMTLPANLAILPAQPPIMILGGLSLLLGSLAAPLGQAAAYLCYPFVAYTIRAVSWFASIPGTVWLTGRTSLFVLVLYYLLLIFLTFRGAYIKEKLKNVKPALAIAAIGMSAVFMWQAALNRPDGRLHVMVLDVGMGEGVLVQSPEGRYILINGGERTSQLSYSLGRWLPLFHRHLDYLVVASSQQEQVAALSGVIPRFPPGEVLWAGPPNAIGDTRYLQQVISEEQIPITTLQTGHTLDLGRGAFLHTLTVGARGAILLLEWDDFRLLLPLGADFESQEKLSMGADVGPVSALMLGDSGYGPANPPDWIAHLQPQLILLSVRAGNREGLPSTDVLDTLADYNLLRTDRNGWIHLTTDGETMWLEAETDW